MAAVGDKDSAPYQSLYRRFRPQRFEEVLGQEHVSLALRNAVRDGRVGHAYLFSGPRGTGKTSTARILAKALNCAALEDGEPCGRCDSCIEIARGASLDVHELDAASNNGVDAMRDLVSHAALGTPGRWKVYIVDEVHMLSTAASNALLKTLEEPPGHVVFVLATTDAQKVLPTIRSRTQHFEFRLLGSETLSALLHQVRTATGLALPDEALDAAVRRGRGSARDALSALDQVAAGGMVDDDIEVLAELAESLAERDPSRALVAVAHASEAGRDPQRLAADLAEYLRQGFLAIVASELVSLAGADRSRVEDTARRMGLPALVRALEELGRAQVDMRDIPDQRVHLEVSLIKLTHPQADDSTSALLERVERLERALAEGGGAGVGPAVPATPPRTLEVPPAPPGGPAPSRAGASAAKNAKDPGRASSPAEVGEGGAVAPVGAASGSGGPPATGAESGPDLARRTLGAVRRQSGSGRGIPRVDTAGNATSRAPGGAEVPSAPKGSDAGPTGAAPVKPAGAIATLPSRDQLVQVWGDGLLAQLPNRARARFRVGRFLDFEGSTAIFALPNETHRSYCEEVRLEVEAALATRFGTAVPIRLVVDDEAADDPVSSRPARPPRGATMPSASTVEVEATATVETAESVDTTGAAVTGVPAIDDSPDLLDSAVLAAETELAGVGLTPEERLKQAFPGAQEV
ncbi:MAG TPA: DNA polymerase III subunit gamma/tau [Acidimicrobiales bacterium]|nr:DNA polymerase III subunit gamma/tau [Acidimicrobiales bacterium]